MRALKKKQAQTLVECVLILASIALFTMVTVMVTGHQIKSLFSNNTFGLQQ